MKANNTIKLIAVLWVFHTLPAYPAGGDAEAGRRKTVTCNACHGQSSMQSVPNLGGQSAAYFVSAMQAYQDGKRGHATMRDVAKAYTDKELKNFAAYYAQFGKRDATKSSHTDKPASAAACESCHGPEGRSPASAESAVIAGQKSVYLQLVLREYRDGRRKHPLMQGAVANLTDDETDVLSAYFSQLEGLVTK